MTIGIGVLCSSKPKPHTPRPDALVLMADTMGSTETDSTSELYKMWIDDDLRIYAVGAGTLEYGGELISILGGQIKEINTSGQPMTHGRFVKAINSSFHILRSQHFQLDVMPQMFLSTPAGPARLAGEEEVFKAWKRHTLDIQMLIATLDHEGQAYLYSVVEYHDEHGQSLPKKVYLCEFPGYATIGTGADNANFWLNYRRQVLGRSVKQSVYHAYEAKLMAAQAPSVNDQIEIAIVVPGSKSFHLTKDTPMADGCPVSLGELQRLFKKYGPQKTEVLGHPKPDR
jgi:hypothetical protein